MSRIRFENIEFYYLFKNLINNKNIFERITILHHYQQHLNQNMFQPFQQYIH